MENISLAFDRFQRKIKACSMLLSFLILTRLRHVMRTSVKNSRSAVGNLGRHGAKVLASPCEEGVNLEKTIRVWQR